MAQIKNVAQGAYVTIIDANDAPKAKLRVAAYARVSSDSADQLNSYLAQVDYYTRFISSREDWELVDVYADEGLTGMETKKRDDFNRMIADCRDGKIDRILVKSVSRFARNQEDYIYYMRELLRLGVTISFEKENLDTGKMNSEQVADIYGAFAQIETTGHSANMRISNRIRMEKGIFVPAKAPYGYRLIQNNLVIVPEEAEVVRRIYQMFLSGQGIFDIANELNQEGVQHTNGTGKWYQYAINYILTNVTYTGDQIWQKTFATDVIPFRKVRNRGQKPKYFAEDCGPAIIDKQEFKAVQELILKKHEKWKLHPPLETLYRERLYCAGCGALCRRKACNGKTYWVCRRHDSGKANCPLRQIEEQQITKTLCSFYHKIWMGRDTVLRPMLSQLEELREREIRFNQKVGDIDKEIAKLAEQNLVLERLKSKGYVDPALYLSEQDAINGKVKDLRKLRRSLMESTDEDEQVRKTEAMLEYLEDSPEWADTLDGELFDQLIERIRLSDDALHIVLHNGLELTERMAS